MSVIIGITGSIASGKTALLEYLATLSHPIFSCDLYVKQLYKDENIVREIISNFPEFQSLNKDSLAKIIYSDPIKRQKLERIIHPLVAKGLENFLEENHDKSSSSLPKPSSSLPKSSSSLPKSSSSLPKSSSSGEDPRTHNIVIPALSQDAAEMNSRVKPENDALWSRPKIRTIEPIFLEIPLLFEAGWEKYCTHIITLCCPVEVRLQRALERGLSAKMFESIDNAQMPEELKVQKSDFIINTNIGWEKEVAEFQRVMKRIY